MARWQQISSEALAVLSNVTTIGEIARAWGLCPDTVRYHCLTGTLTARQDMAGRWLVYLPSARALYGKPTTEIQIEV